MSLVIELLGTAGDAPGFAGGVDPLIAVLVAASLSDAYRHSLSDLTHVAQRGLCSSHLMRRPLHVRLYIQSALFDADWTQQPQF